MLKDHLAKRRDVEILLSEETDVLLGTGGGIVKALPYFEGKSFFVHNSDSVWVEGIGRALARMKGVWNPDEMDALLLLASMVTSIGFEGMGDFLLDSEGYVARVPEMQVAPFAYPGVQIVHPRIFENAPQGEFSMNVLWDRAIEKERLFGLRLDGTWMHVGTAEAVKEAEAFLADLAPA